jgi:hypothetical protein
MEQGCEADDSPPSSVEVKAVEQYLHSFLSFDGVVLK